MSKQLGLIGRITFVAGIALIVAATAMNVALDRMTDAQVSQLPAFITDLYDTAGKLGVTLLLVGIGLAVIVFGIALQCDFLLSRKTGNEEGGPYLNERGQPMALSTWQYFDESRKANS
ncbi:MAG: hypothetical protein L0241_22400 [Planctomycetia bacterium]|nr:hypothetical protein [Planctomycetia bacterium]